MTPPSWLAPVVDGAWLATATPWLLALAGCVAALVVAQWSWRLVGKVLRDRASAQLVMLVQRAVWWGICGVALSTALRTLGFDLSLFLGAAGIVTVSVGFASQTAASNLISGLFLVAERPFVVGDLITVGDTTGEVVTVDLLSVKLRTFDNRLVRIPNEVLLKTSLANLTHFAIRRVDLAFVVPYDADPDRVRALATQIADDATGVLDEPRPVVQFSDFVLEGASFQVSAWARREDYYETRNRLARDLLVGFRAAGVLFAAPVRVSVRSG